MKRLTAVAGLLVALALPASSAAFHHGALPTRPCANSTMASANPTAREAIRNRNPVMNPGPTFPPFTTPGAEHSGSTPAEENCANAQP